MVGLGLTISPKVSPKLQPSEFYLVTGFGKRQLFNKQTTRTGGFCFRFEIISLTVALE